MTTKIIFGLSAMLVILFIETNLPAQEQQPSQEKRLPQNGWSSFFTGGAVQQFTTDMDEGGSFDATRFTIQAGQSYAWNQRNSVSAALGYSYDGYGFSGNSGLAGIAPWSDIHTVSFSLPMRLGFDKEWTAFFVPTVRSTGETGADFGDSITGGGFVGASYRFNDTLTIGPGIGVIGQLEAGATLFPVLIINWKMTERMSLETGSGLGATLGPGLVVTYQATDKWKFGLGGRYEKLRFRLDKNGDTAGGIGEDSSFPLFATCSYSFDHRTNISLIGGFEVGGNLRLEDDKGNLIIEDSSETGGFLGLAFSMRF